MNVLKHWGSARPITSPVYRPSGVQGPHGRVGASRTRTTLTTLADGASPTQDVRVGRVVRVVKHTIAGGWYGDCPIDCPIDCVIAAFDCPIDWITIGCFGGRRGRQVPNTRHFSPAAAAGGPKRCTLGHLSGRRGRRGPKTRGFGHGCRARGLVTRGFGHAGPANCG